ncbi:MAG TPA: dihydropteroate synthase [Xanthobacteraceae bacterium]|nr:dihydropteroate synthase [Xanthobacteraceae bacterium]
MTPPDEDVAARRERFLAGIGARPMVMGILNLTPDSFSDGGKFQDLDAALARAARMAADGADIVDVGAESTRPGATPVSAAAELARLEPVLAELVRRVDVPLSIDTYKATVAARAAELGVVAVNDVGGLQRDPAMADVVAQAQVAVVIMHSRPAADAAIDIVADIKRSFARSLAIAARAGIPTRHIMLDPGIAFGKTSRQNREVIARIAELKEFMLPILIGVSRKSFLGSLIDRGLEASLAGTIAANLAAAAGGAAIFRVHDVAEHVAALRVFDTIRAAMVRAG